MKISIITPSYNQAAFIRDTVESVRSQNDADCEHWVIDGGSTDGTVDILRQYPNLHWVSERDEGQSDALRKGLARATGEIIGWINSDDYYSPNCFEAVRSAFKDPSVRWVIGDLTYRYEGTGREISDKSPTITHEALCLAPDIVRQQSTFFRRDILIEAGGWNPKYHMTMDYDLWTRLAHLSTPKMISLQLAYFRIHEAQKTAEKNIQTQADELAEIMRREGAPAAAISQMQAVKRRLITKLRLKTFLIKAGVLPQRYLSQPIRLG